MKLHISCDIIDLDKAIELTQSIAQYADILKIDTPLIYKHGIHSVERFRQAFPKQIISADAKIVNHIQQNIPMFASAGANWITLMAGIHKNTIHTACNTAHALNAKIMLDLSDSISATQSALDAKNLGVDALLFNYPHDATQQAACLETWEMIMENTTVPVFIAAHVTHDTIKDIINMNPSGIILGGSIMQAQNHTQQAKLFYNTIKGIQTS